MYSYRQDTAAAGRRAAGRGPTTRGGGRPTPLRARSGARRPRRRRPPPCSGPRPRDRSSPRWRRDGNVWIIESYFKAVQIRKYLGYERIVDNQTRYYRASSLFISSRYLNRHDSMRDPRYCGVVRDISFWYWSMVNVVVTPQHENSSKIASKRPIKSLLVESTW